MFVDKHKNVKNKRERPMRPLSFPKVELSHQVDLREWMSPIENQKDMNTCCANAYAGVCEYIFRRHFNWNIDVSRLFIYYNGQIISQGNLHVADKGVHQRCMALGMRKYGICEEKIWPYREDLLNFEPSYTAYYNASYCTVVPLRIPFNIKAIETCLHHQLPILININLVDRLGLFVKLNGGYLKIPNLKDVRVDEIDFHTVVLVGYDRDARHFIVRNSWGRFWGKKGYCYMPYDYLSDERLVNPYDGLWTISRIVQRTNKLPEICQLVLPNDEKKRH